MYLVLGIEHLHGALEEVIVWCLMIGIWCVLQDNKVGFNSDDRGSCLRVSPEQGCSTELFPRPLMGTGGSWPAVN